MGRRAGQCIRRTVGPVVWQIICLELAILARGFQHLVARAADGEALLVQKATDAADHQHFVVLVIAAVAAPFHRTQLCKLLLPITEHMRLDTAKLAHLTNSEVAFCGNGWEGILQLNQCA